MSINLLFLDITDRIEKTINYKKMTNFLQKSLIITIASAIPLALATPFQAEIQAQQVLGKSQPQNTQMKKIVFDFDNTYDYAACLDVILLAYEQRNIELQNAYKNDCATNILNTFGNNLQKDLALQLIESADSHATEGLENPLYPSLGLRRRIAINLGYVYDMDKNNPNILKYVNPKSE